MDQFSGILFIDIETVPITESFADLNENMQSHWEKKSKQVKPGIEGNTDPASLFAERAGVFSEFAKVVCIGIGNLFEVNGKMHMRLKALVNDDEKLLLNNFINITGKFSNHYKDLRFCGHNIKEFDLPFLSRRMVINRMQLPNYMQFAGKKPWEVPHLDTLDLWKFGDFKHFTTLSLLAEILGIPSPKSDLDGSKVAGVYWEEHDLERIGRYCLQDVITSAKVYMSLTGHYDHDITAVYAND